MILISPAMIQISNVKLNMLTFTGHTISRIAHTDKKYKNCQGYVLQFRNHNAQTLLIFVYGIRKNSAINYI